MALFRKVLYHATLTNAIVCSMYTVEAMIILCMHSTVHLSNWAAYKSTYYDECRIPQCKLRIKTNYLAFLFQENNAAFHLPQKMMELKWHHTQVDRRVPINKKKEN